ncbi:MAG: winged helix-turn-helix transcriptional regulator [Halobacteriota archaeon]
MNMKQSKEFGTVDSRARHVIRLAQALAKKIALDEKELTILLSLLGNAKTSNAELAERLGLSDGNAAAYHIKRLKTRAVLTRYTIQIDWRKIGFPADFVILAESDEKAALLALERHLVLLQDYYEKHFGYVPLLPTSSGYVLLRDISYCYGDKTMLVVAGSATSDLDIAFFRENYITRALEGIRTTLMTTRYRSVDNFVIQSSVLDTLCAIFDATSASEEEISRIREHLKSTVE